MKVKAYRTRKIKAGDKLENILEHYLPDLMEKSIVVVTSKIVSLCQGNVVKMDGKIEKTELIKNEADYYFIDDKLSKYGVVIPTIKNSILIANAGIDESNADGYFVLWPKSIDEAAEKVWGYLRKKNSVKELGVIITDSHLIPLRSGVHAVGITWCGFAPLKDYRGNPDIFGRIMQMEQENLVDELGIAASVVMGEGNEQTPLAVITDVPFVLFQDRPPTKAERKNTHIEKEDDIYGKFLTSVKWEKGGGLKNEK